MQFVILTQFRKDCVKYKEIRLFDIFKRASLKFLAHDMLTHTKAVTYQVLFSFLPFAIFFIALLGFFDLSNLFDLLRSQSDVFFLTETMSQMNLIVDQLQQRRHGMLSFGVVFAIWASSSAMRSMMKALDIVYGVAEKRPGWERLIVSISATLVIGVMLAAIVTLLLARPMAVQSIVQQAKIKPIFAFLWAWWIRWPVIFLLLTATVFVVFRTAPGAHRRFHAIAPGALFAVLAWFLASLSFDIYVRNVAGYDHLYGNLGTIVVLLVYFFISSFIFLFGAELNAAIQESSVRASKNDGAAFEEDEYLW